MDTYLNKLLFHRFLRACLNISIEALFFLRIQTLIDLLSALLSEKLELRRDVLVVHHLDILFEITEALAVPS